MENLEFTFTNIDKINITRQLACLHDGSCSLDNQKRRMHFRETTNGFILGINEYDHCSYFELHGLFEVRNKESVLACKVVEKFPLRYIPVIFFFSIFIMITIIFNSPQNRLSNISFIAVSAFILFGNYLALYFGRNKATEIFFRIVSKVVSEKVEAAPPSPSPPK